MQQEAVGEQVGLVITLAYAVEAGAAWKRLSPLLEHQIDSPKFSSAVVVVVVVVVIVAVILLTRNVNEAFAE